jgi:hypothetical protein
MVRSKERNLGIQKNLWAKLFQKGMLNEENNIELKLIHVLEFQ